MVGYSCRYHSSIPSLNGWIKKNKLNYFIHGSECNERRGKQLIEWIAALPSAINFLPLPWNEMNCFRNESECWSEWSKFISMKREWVIAVAMFSLLHSLNLLSQDSKRAANEKKRIKLMKLIYGAECNWREGSGILF